MRPLPLFPLPTVLLPGAAMPLHIFEPRYRRMVGYCLEHDRKFGLLYHDPDESGPFLAEPGRVGCIAEIGRIRILDDGRSLILTRGGERFRIERSEEDDAVPYYQAHITAFPDVVGDSALLERARRSSLDLFHSIVDRMTDLPEPAPRFDVEDELSFRLASTIDTAPSWHQELLEMPREVERLRRVDTVFRAASTLIDDA